MNSFNHYSLGSVGHWMTSTVVGIDMETPGFDRIVIKPIPGGDLKWAKGSYQSMHGRIESSWRREGSKFTLDVTIPANTTATVYIPAKSVEDVQEGGRSIDQILGIRYIKMENGAVVLEVGGGRYRFVGGL